METRRLGPVVGLGTWNTFGADRDGAREVVGGALSAGCRWIDTSPMYGEAESSLAAALDGRRSDAHVATKIWARSLAEGRSQFGAQLAWYGRLELEQIHNLVSWREHLPWLESERDAGKIDRLGVTHYDARAFDELAGALATRRFDVVQLPYNPLERECERALLPLASELGVAVVVMRPLGQGSLLRQAPSERELKPLRDFGVETWPQALIKWVLSDERVDVVIPATRRAERAARNAAAGKPPWFGARERRYVEGLVRP